VTGLERVLLPQKRIGRGDVVVFKYPEQPDRDFIKRVIGLPGDRLELRRKRVFINDVPLDEPYVRYLEAPSADGIVRAGDLREEYGPVTVPEGQYFMMGDNRDNSEDSRYWGFLPASYVKGEALVIYFSVGDAAAGSDAVGGIRWGRLANLVR
jgi:signal peptidase I